VARVNKDSSPDCYNDDDNILSGKLTKDVLNEDFRFTLTTLYHYLNKPEKLQISIPAITDTTRSVDSLELRESDAARRRL